MTKFLDMNLEIIATEFNINHELSFNNSNWEHNLENNSIAVHDGVFSSSDEEVLFPQEFKE